MHHPLCSPLRRLAPAVLGIFFGAIFIASGFEEGARSSAIQPGGLAIREWKQGEPSLRLIEADKGVCALLSVSGHFQGGGEWAGLWIGADNYWYLGGRSAQQDVSASCVVIPLSAMQMPMKSDPGPASIPESSGTIWSESGLAPWRDLKLSSPSEGKLDPYNDSAWVNGREFPPGQFLWMHAPKRVVYTFEQPITQFRSGIALRDGGSMGNVTFQVETDSGLVFQSMPIAHRSTNYSKFTIEFPPTTKLILTTQPNGPNYEDWAMWLSPQVR
jgi:hypothetical protein